MRSVAFIVSVPERSKGVDSSSTVFALVGSNPTADMRARLSGDAGLVPVWRLLACTCILHGPLTLLAHLSLHAAIGREPATLAAQGITRPSRLLHAFLITEQSTDRAIHTLPHKTAADIAVKVTVSTAQRHSTSLPTPTALHTIATSLPH